MNLKDQAKKYGVCDLEYSQELKKLGCKQEGIWWWDLRENRVVIREEKWGAEEYISAPTASELWERLPFQVNDYDLWIIKHIDNKQWIVAYTKEAMRKTLKSFKDTLANAMTKMLIYLIKNKPIEAKWKNILRQNRKQ